MRERDPAGRIVASLQDYVAVRGLVAELVSEGLEATVPASVREAVTAVAELADASGVSVGGVAARLKLDKASASRRTRAAVESGFLNNLEDRPGKPSRLILGEPLPEDQPVLPLPEALAECCTVAGVSPGVHTPSPPNSDVGEV
jgi:hypothetical protein